MTNDHDKTESAWNAVHAKKSWIEHVFDWIDAWRIRRLQNVIACEREFLCDLPRATQDELNRLRARYLIDVDNVTENARISREDAQLAIKEAKMAIAELKAGERA